MKQRLFILLLIVAVGAVLGSCATTGTHEDYFGYNNHPKLDENNNSVGEEYDWDNPLGADYNGDDNFTVNYDYYNMPPSYIPVVVPWYAGYHSWYNTPFSGFYVGFGYSPYPYYDWYSPFYTHCPYYYNPHIYYGGNRWWDWYPYSGGAVASNDRPKKTYRIRDFGPQRGTYTSSGTPYAGGSSSSSGRTGDRSRRTVSNNSDVAGAGAQKRITYKPVTPVKGNISGFGKSRSADRNRKHSTYNKNSKTYSPVGNTSGFGSSKSSSFGGSSSGGSKSSGGSSRSSSGSRSSSSRSSGRGK
jgi:hypothetical protein